MSIVERELPAAIPVITEAEQVLLDAERYMKEHGWVRGTCDPHGRVCLVDSLSRAAGHDSHLFWEGLRYLDAAVRTKDCRSDACIVDWNDRECPDEQEALATLRRARELAAWNRHGLGL